LPSFKKQPSTPENKQQGCKEHFKVIERLQQINKEVILPIKGLQPSKNPSTCACKQ
jgi:hypothetical protein